MIVGATFERFLRAIQLTPTQRTLAEQSARGVIDCVSAAYWWPGVDPARPGGYVIGSYQRGVAVRPPRDVDVLVRLPWSTKDRVDALSGNVQSRLLADVRRHLRHRYPRTDIYADGPTVTVPFGTYAVEVVPAFEYDHTSYLIPDTSDGGRWRRAEPWGELVTLNRADEQSNGAARHLVQMLKTWQYEHAVPIKSFHLELLAIEFLDAWHYRRLGSTFYDWMVRDFFTFLLGRADAVLTHPHTGERMWLWDDWVPDARRALRQATDACDFAEHKIDSLAIDKWRAVFGADFPTTS